jgi:hypothetical protein
MILRRYSIGVLGIVMFSGQVLRLVTKMQEGGITNLHPFMVDGNEYVEG